MPNDNGLDTLVSDPQFMQLAPEDQRRALAGVSKDDSFSSLNDDQTSDYVNQHRQSLGVPPIAPMPKVNMQGSSVPGYVRGAAAALPVAGAIGGAVVGAPAFGGGAVVGGGLGAAAGESARQGILRSVFGPDETSPTSKQGMTQDATAGAVGSISELPGTLLQGYGNSVLRGLATAKSSKEVGDAMEAIQKVAPFRISRQGMIDAIEAARKQLSSQFGVVARMTKGTSDLDQALQPVLKTASDNDLAFGQKLSNGSVIVRGGGKITRPLNDALTAAKIKAGITDSQNVTVQQYADFRRALSDVFDAKEKAAASSIVKDRLQDAYRAVNGELDKLAPPARALDDQMTDMHAAKSALKNYKSMGPIKSLAVGAATNPRTTAIVSPAIIPAATEAGRPVIRAGRSLAEAIP